MYLDIDTGTFNQSLVIRESRDCSQGQRWYVCSLNNFRGCCSVDACSVSTCPDTNTAAVGASSSSKSSSSEATSSSTATSSSSSSITTSTTPSQTTASSQTTSQAPSLSLSPSTLLITTTVNHSITTSTSPSSSPSTLAQVSPAPQPSNSAPIIAGAVVGGIAIICFAMAAFCCFRFRQKKKQDRERMFAEPESPDPEIIQFYSTTGKKLQTPSTTRVSRSTSGGGFAGLGGLGLGDVFAPFGGGSSNSSTRKPTSPPDAPVPAPIPAMTQPRIRGPVYPVHPIQGTNQVHTSPIPESQEDHETDTPLSPDPEKSSLTPPPESSHPAFHPLPGMAGTRPAYRPGMSFTINELDGREVDHVPFGTAGGSRRVSSGEIRGEGGGSGSDGAVSAMSSRNSNGNSSGTGRLSAMSTPTSAPASSNVPPLLQGQSNWHTPPNILLPGRPAPTQSQSYHRRGNFPSSGSNPNMTNPSQSTHAQTQYAKQQAQARLMNASVIQNPYQMYGESREHQQNMGYQNALVRAQELQRERLELQTQSQAYRQPQTQRGNNVGLTGEQTHAGLKRENSTHSIPIGLGLDAQQKESSSAQPSQRNASPGGSRDREANARSQVHANRYGNEQIVPQPPQHTRSMSESTSVSSMGSSPNIANLNSARQMEPYRPSPIMGSPQQGFEYRVMAPTPPPMLNQHIQDTMRASQTQTQDERPQNRSYNHILSWAEYDGGGDLAISPVLDGKGKGKEVAR